MFDISAHTNMPAFGDAILGGIQTGQGIRKSALDDYMARQKIQEQAQLQQLGGQYLSGDQGALRQMSAINPTYAKGVLENQGTVRKTEQELIAHAALNVNDQSSYDAFKQDLFTQGRATPEEISHYPEKYSEKVKQEFVNAARDIKDLTTTAQDDRQFGLDSQKLSLERQVHQQKIDAENQKKQLIQQLLDPNTPEEAKQKIAGLLNPEAAAKAIIKPAPMLTPKQKMDISSARDELLAGREAVNRLLEEVTNNPSKAGILGAARSIGETASGVVGDVASAIPGLGMFKAPVSAATKLIPGFSSESGESVRGLKPVENKLSVALARARFGDTGRIPVQQLDLAKKDSTVSGLFSSGQAADSLKAIRDEIEGSLKDLAGRAEESGVPFEIPEYKSSAKASNKNTPPKGVDPKDWEFMTPEQKALFNAK